MTEATVTPVQMPQRWDWDPIDYCTVESVPHPTGYWVDADDVEPLVAEINRLRAEVARLQTLNSKAAEVITTATNALVIIAQSFNGHPVAASTIQRLEHMLRVP